MLKRSASTGFTLVEILTGLTVIAVLIGIGVPTLSSYLQSAKLASATNSYLSGLQQARAEAIRRNFPAEFVLTDTPMIVPNAAADRNAFVTGIAALPTGRSWVVRASQPAPDPFAFVEAKAGVEGAFAGNATSIEVAANGPVGFDGSIAFNGFGRPLSGEPYTIAVSNPGGGQCAANGGPMRCQSVRVTRAGRIMICDPEAPPGDSRFCAD